MLGQIDIKSGRLLEFDHLSKKRRPLKTQFFDTESLRLVLIGTLIESQSSFSATKTLESIQSSGVDHWLSEVDGLFFLYLFDKNLNRHYLINNHYQGTQLYFQQTADRLIFFDQIDRALRLRLNREVHFPSVINFLRNGFNQSEQTQLKGIKKLLPSFWIEIADGRVEIKNRWKKHFIIDRKPFANLDEKIDDYERVYRQSLSRYFDSRNPEQIGLLLSGGHDTSYLMIQASQVAKKPLHAFTVTFPDWTFSEHQYAENICQKFGGIFHDIPFNGSHLDLTKDMIEACEEPVLGSTLPLHALAKEAAQVTDTLLGGDGGDTLWGEYYPVAEYHQWVQSWPLTFRRAAHKVSQFLRDSSDWERFWELEHVAALFAQEDIYSNFMGRLCTYRHFSDQYLQSLLIPEIAKIPPQTSCLEIPFNQANFSDALIEGKLFNAFLTYQGFQQTKSINSFGIEFFLPTIQRDVANFINSLPHNWLNGGTTFHRLSNSKSINRRFHKLALQRYLKREEIYNRSFDIPWHQIFSTRPEILDQLYRDLSARGWYQEETLRSLFDQFKSQRPKSYELLELKSHGYRIMALYSLELWCQRFLDSAE